MEIIINILKQNGAIVLKGIATGLTAIWSMFIRPFFFSHKKSYIKAVYVYVGIAMFFFFDTIQVFVTLSKEAAYHGIHDAGIVLGTLATVIATLIALVTLMMKAYNDGKEDDTTPPTDKPTGVQ